MLHIIIWSVTRSCKTDSRCRRCRPLLLCASAGVPAWERGETVRRSAVPRRVYSRPPVVCLNLSQGHYWRRRPDTWHQWWANPKSNARCRFMAELLITWSSRRLKIIDAVYAIKNKKAQTPCRFRFKTSHWRWRLDVNKTAILVRFTVTTLTHTGTV